MLTQKVSEERIRFERADDPEYLTGALSRLAFRLPRVRVTVIGESVMGRPISLVSVGKSPCSRGVLYAGGMQGTDSVTPAVLLRFLYELAEAAEADRRLYNIRIAQLTEGHVFHVIPMLNPDGYAMVKQGVGEIPIRERLIRQNGGEDFSHWTKNARGVELNANFRDTQSEAADGLSAGSEPETEALCSWVRLADGATAGLALSLALFPGNEPLRFSSGDVVPLRARTVGRLLSRMTGASFCRESPEGRGFSDWFMRETGKPGFSFGCLPEGSAPIREAAEYVSGYVTVREALFSAPLL